MRPHMPDPAPNLALHTRSTPKQARARARVQQILSAAIRVLEQRPAADLSATVVAAEAGIPVSSVYRYFPTPDDLVAEIYLSAAAALRDGLQRAVSEGAGGWRARLRAVLGLMRGFLRDHPYYRALLVRMAAQRGPQTIDHDYNADLVAFFVERWQAGADGFRGAAPRVVATVAVQMVLTLEELLMQPGSPADEEAYFAEVCAALEGYLGRYLSDAEAADV